MNKNVTSNVVRFNTLIKKHEEIYHNASKLFGISDAALMIFYFVRMAEKFITQSEICAELYLPKQTVNSALKKLLELGFINQQFAENNKKSKVIQLTASGLEFCTSSIDIVIEAEKTSILKFSDSEQALFFSLYEKYINTLSSTLQTNLLKK